MDKCNKKGCYLYCENYLSNCKRTDKVSECIQDAPLTPNKDAGAKVACGDGLCVLQKLSDQWRGEAEQRSQPPQDEFDMPCPDAVETLLYCADELDKAIKEINT